MTMKTILISSALIAGLATATASAQPGRGEPPRTRDEVIERAIERFKHLANRLIGGHDGRHL